MLRLIRFLEKAGKVKLDRIQDGETSRLMLVSAEGKRLIVNDKQFRDALSAGLVRKGQGNIVELLPEGLNWLKRQANQEGDFACQHREVVTEKRMIDGELVQVTSNLEESPLVRLRRRKRPDGKPWIDDAQFAAGERFRRDFTLGGLMQKITSSWDPSAGARGSTGGSGAKAELTITAIDARSRLQEAIDLVGSELAGVLTDFCCYLKGLETIERERRWPPRSAKLMLRAGLDLLARYYGTRAGHA